MSKRPDVSSGDASSGGERFMTKNNGYVYILQSERNNTYYIGSTNNIERRFEQHKLGDVKYTRNLRPLALKFYQKYNNLKQARQIEYKLKRFKRKDIISRIIEEKSIKMGV